MTKISDNITSKASETIKFIEVNEFVSLRLICFSHHSQKSNTNIVMLTGLATTINSFRIVIDEITSEYGLYYLETREKSSSQIRENTKIDIESMGCDLAEVVNNEGIDKDNYVLLGYSMGATVIIDCYRHFENKPRCVIFLEPTPVFNYPKWSIILIRNFAVKFYNILKTFAKWYLGKFYINKKIDNEMAVISSYSLDNADPKKLKKAILGIAGYEVWDKLKFIDCPVLVVGTSKDGLHKKYETTRMINSIKNCKFIDLETNLRTHSAEMGMIVKEYIKNLNLSTNRT